MRAAAIVAVAGAFAAAALPAALPGGGLAAQDVAVAGGTVLPVSGPPIENGTVLVRDGRIAAVGADVRVPDGVRVVDASGKYVLPGLVDAMSYYGIASGDLNETSSPSTPQLRILEAYYPFGELGSEAGPPHAEALLQGGVTAHYIAPADATVIGGQGAVVKAAGDRFEDLVLREPAAIDITLGERPAATFREGDRAPGTRMAVVSHLRERLVAAREYVRKLEEYEALPAAEREEAAEPSRDLGMEALARLLRGEIPARVQANRTVEIRNAMDLAEELGFEVIIDSGIEAVELADRLAESGVPVVLGPIAHPYVSGEEIPDEDEYPDPDERRAGKLHEAGVEFALASFSRTFGRLGPEGSGKWLLLDAALAAGYGLPEEAAIRAITLAPAEILGVADRIGSLEPGKDGDLVILDGPPLAVTTWVERVFVDGREVFVREAAE